MTEAADKIIAKMDELIERVEAAAKSYTGTKTTADPWAINDRLYKEIAALTNERDELARLNDRAEAQRAALSDTIEAQGRKIIHLMQIRDQNAAARAMAERQRDEWKKTAGERSEEIHRLSLITSEDTRCFEDMCRIVAEYFTSSTREGDAMRRLAKTMYKHLHKSE